MARTKPQRQVLLIDDDRMLLEVLAMQLKHDAYAVDTASSGQQGFEKASSKNYDIIILDMGLPDKPGVEVCRDIRSQGVLTPILILSGNTEKDTIVKGLEAGADDYLVKPFYKDELKARLSALIRREQRIFPARQLSAEGVILDVVERTIQAGSQVITLTSLETSVLKCLFQCAPDVVPREYFFEQVWGINDEHTSNRLDVYIKRVRKKLKPLEQYAKIHTVHSRGYRFGK